MANPRCIRKHPYDLISAYRWYLPMIRTNTIQARVLAERRRRLVHAA